MSDSQNHGLGVPPEGHPDFTAPTSASAPRPDPPDFPPASWAPPEPEPAQPRHPRRITALVVVISLFALAGLSGLLALLNQPVMAPGPTTSVSPSGAPIPIVTVTPTPVPDTQSRVSGGQIGVGMDFDYPTGAGTLTVTDAWWTAAGQMRPPDGQLNLVVRVQIRVTAGELFVDTSSFRVTGIDKGQRLAGFGPSLADPLGGRLLRAGDSIQGEVGFVLRPGTTSFELLDDELLPRATVEIPGP